MESGPGRGRHSGGGSTLERACSLRHNWRLQVVCVGRAMPMRHNARHESFAQSVASRVRDRGLSPREGSVRATHASLRRRTRWRSRGYHTLKICMVNLSVVVQKVVMSTSQSRNGSTHLNPPENYLVESGLS
jgi:hypothetical protein